MSIWDTARSAANSVVNRAQSAVDTVKEKAKAVEQKVEQTAQKVEQKVEQTVEKVEQKVSSTVSRAEKKVQQKAAELSGKVSSFEKKAAPLVAGGLKAEVSAPGGSGGDAAAIAAKVDTSPTEAARDIKKALDAANYFTNDGVSQEIAEKMTDSQLVKLASTPEGKAQLEQMRDDMKAGYTTDGEQKQIDRIDAAIGAAASQAKVAAAEAKRLDPEPSMSVSNGDGPAEKQVDDMVARASVSARGSDAEVKTLVDTTLNEAKTLDPTHAGDLLSRTADKLMAAGRYTEARTLLTELKKDPVGSTSVDWVGKHSGGDSTIPASNGNTVMTLHSGVVGTFSKLADTRLAQCDQVDKMAKVLGKPANQVNPYDVNQVRSYFQALRANGSMADVGKEYQTYLQNFVKHPGGKSNTWPDPKSNLVDAPKMNEVLKGQPKDAAGRMLLDCEGTVYLTGAIFGNDPKNKIVYTSGGGHISASVFDAATGKGFHVNTAALDGVVTTLRDPPAKTDRQRQERAWIYHQEDGKPGPQPDKLPAVWEVKDGDGKVIDRAYIGEDITKAAAPPPHRE